MEPNIPKVLHLTSDRVPLMGRQSELYELNFPHFREWRIQVWDDAKNSQLVKDYFPQWWDRYESLPFGVMKADVARLIYMHVVGGWYSDTDYRWLREPQLPSHDCTLVLPLSRDITDPEGRRIGNAVFGSAPGEEFWSDAVCALFSQGGLLGATKESIERLTGPEFLTDFASGYTFSTGAWLPERRFFHPANADEADGPPENAFGYHMTLGSWRPATYRAKASLKRLLKAWIGRIRPQGSKKADL